MAVQSQSTTIRLHHVIRTLLYSLREYRKASLRCPLFVVVESVIEIVIPTIMAVMIDKGIAAGSMEHILFYGGLLVVLACISIGAGVFSGKNAAIASAGLAHNLRHDVFTRVQELSFSDIDRFSTASIITRLTTDVTNVQSAYQMVVRIGLRSPIMMIVAWLFALRISPMVALVFLIVMPLLAVGLFGLFLYVKPIFIKVFETYDELNNVVEENLLGIRAVKSYNRQAYESNKFNAVSQRIYERFSHAERLLSLDMPIFQASMYVTMLAISWVGAQQIVHSGNIAANGLTTGDLTALIAYAMQILVALMMLSFVFVMLMIAQAGGERIAQVLQTESSLLQPNNPISTLENGSIDFDNVVFRYAQTSTKPVLDHVSLHIKSGQTVGILGNTGSSKSSLVQLIARLYDVSEGSVRVSGRDVREYDLQVLRDEVAMVLQKNMVFEGTIAENLRWGNANATDEELRHAAHLAQADKFIDELPKQYETMVEQGGANLSGGQRQRLCIARALLKEPRIIILDDSTSAVDMKTDKRIRQGLRTYLPATTKIIIAQRIASVQEADHIVLLHDGHVLAEGTHESLLASCGEYRSIYLSQTRTDMDEQGESSANANMSQDVQDAHESTTREAILPIDDLSQQVPSAKE